MQTAIELHRHSSPATRPQPLAYLAGTLWMGSWDTDHLYAIDPNGWTVREEIAAPGRPYGLAAIGNELRVVVALGEEDDRYLFRFVPGQGFDESSKTACPDFTGSHLAAQGEHLFLGQMHDRRILVLDGQGAILRQIALPTRCGGFGFGPGGRFFMISGDEELEHLRFGTLDVTQAAPQFEGIASIDDNARCLAHDGTRWFTSLRESNEIATFS